MGDIATELIIIFVLILANGFFAGAEIAIIAAGRGRLQQQAAAGNHGAKLAIGLAADPSRFLPTVQVGISLIGTFAAEHQRSRSDGKNAYYQNPRGHRRFGGTHGYALHRQPIERA